MSHGITAEEAQKKNAFHQIIPGIMRCKQNAFLCGAKLEQCSTVTKVQDLAVHWDARHACFGDRNLISREFRVNKTGNGGLGGEGYSSYCTFGPKMLLRQCPAVIPTGQFHSYIIISPRVRA